MARTRHIALLIETSRAYGRGLLRGVTRYLHEHPHWSIYVEPRGLDDPAPRWLKNWKGDGILARINNRAMADAVMRTGIPVVDLRGALEDLGLPFIGIDNEVVSRMAADHLMDRGLRTFAFVGAPRKYNRFIDLRSDCFAHRIRTAGFPCEVYQHPVHKKRGVSWDEEQDNLTHWLKSLPKPLGLMACHDEWGQQVLDACRRAELAVPDQVAVVGVDNDLLLCGLSDPPLTSVDVNAEQIGHDAAAMLDRMMGGQAPPKEPIYIRPRGVVTRRSTDILAIGDRLTADAVRFIREHFHEGITVEDMIHAVPLSRSVLERRFKRWLGRSPKSEIIRLQVERACTLLVETNLPLATVAQLSGFRHAKYLSEVFRKRTGHTPSQYRKQFQRQQ